MPFVKPYVNTASALRFPTLTTRMAFRSSDLGPRRLRHEFQEFRKSMRLFRQARNLSNEEHTPGYVALVCTRRSCSRGYSRTSKTHMHVLGIFESCTTSIVSGPVCCMLGFSGCERDRFRFQSLSIEQDERACLLEGWHCDEPDLLASRSFNDVRSKMWLIANEKDVRTFSNDERITILEWIAPCKNVSIRSESSCYCRAYIVYPEQLAHYFAI